MTKVVWCEPCKSLPKCYRLLDLVYLSMKKIINVLCNEKKTVSKCNEEIVTRGQNIWDKF